MRQPKKGTEAEQPIYRCMIWMVRRPIVCVQQPLELCVRDFFL